MRRRGVASVLALTIIPIVLAFMLTSYGPNAQDHRVSNSEARASNSSPTYVRLKMVRIVDNETFSEPTEAMRMLIPADWKLEGEVKWFIENRACAEMENISAVTFRVSSPDGLWSLERFPNSFWVWVTGPSRDEVERKTSCPLHEPVSVGSYVTDQLLPKVRPGAQILSVQSKEEMSRAVMEAVKRGNATALYLGLNVSAKVECANVDYEYPVNGHLVRESVLGTMLAMANKKPVSHGKGGSTTYLDFYTIHASDFNASRVPEGESRTGGAIFARIMMSLRTNPRWIAGRRAVASRLARSSENSEGVLRHNKLPEMTDQQILNAYKKQVDARTPTAKEYDPYVLPMQAYIDPKINEAFELNGGFAFAWTNHEDEYILTNEENFTPAELFKEDWVLLRPVTSSKP